jgi:hypothetical protein
MLDIAEDLLGVSLAQMNDNWPSNIVHQVAVACPVSEDPLGVRTWGSSSPLGCRPTLRPAFRLLPNQTKHDHTMPPSGAKIYVVRSADRSVGLGPARWFRIGRRR